jgi:NADPH:quinone reductase-like Zn-dependent oxidoreductase
MESGKKIRGVLLSKVGGAFEIVDNIDMPKPGKGQILVKSLVTGINPVEGFMQSTGVLVTSWPIVLGCDASGIVVETGEGVTKFGKDGGARAGVFGCTRLGIPGYCTFQEYVSLESSLVLLGRDLYVLMLRSS